MPAASVVDPFRLWLARLDPEGEFSGVEREMLRELVAEVRPFEAHEILVPPEQMAGVVVVIVQGVACRWKDTSDGTRQIISFLVPGDHTYGEFDFVIPRDHRISALSDGRGVLIRSEAIREFAEESPRFRRAMHLAIAQEMAVAREWIVNLGARGADGRLAHLFCEMMWRLRAAGLASERSCPLMLRQQDLGDASGLSAVHVNRVLQKLRRAGLIRLDGDRLTILDEARLEELADFQPDYLMIGREVHHGRRRTASRG